MCMGSRLIRGCSHRGGKGAAVLGRSGHQNPSMYVLTSLCFWRVKSSFQGRKQLVVWAKLDEENLRLFFSAPFVARSVE